VIIGAILIIVPALSAHDKNGAPSPIWFKGLLCAIALPIVILGLRTAFSSIETRPDGLVVRKVLSTRRVAWNSVARFDVARTGMIARSVVVRLENGESISCIGLVASNPYDMSIPRIAAALNDELLLHREI
jgi:hypothetical protein